MKKAEIVNDEYTEDDKVEILTSYFSEISNVLGIDKTESNENTSLRLAKMYVKELFKNINDANLEELQDSMALFPNEKRGFPTPIVCKGIRVTSTCEHHWLPFIGTATITYIPNERIIGLSKIPRIIDYFSKRPQLQERLTDDIGEFLVATLEPEYVKVEINSVHTCVLCRGAESDSNTTTFFEYRSGE